MLGPQVSRPPLPVARWLPIGLAALVSGVALAFAPIYSEGFGPGYLDYDDPENLVANPHWRELTGANLAWMLSSAHMGHYQPLTWLSFALEAALFGPDPGTMHATNIALHALSAVLLVFVARRLLLALRPDTLPALVDAAGLLAGGLFALHPLRCESVCWLTERRDVLSGVFYLVALLAWLRFVQDGRRERERWIAIAALALSLAAKAWGITFFAVLLVLDLGVLRRRAGTRGESWSALLREKLPFAGLAFVFGGLAWWAQAQAGSTLQSFEQHGPVERGLQAAYASLHYLVQTVAPFGLHPAHELPERFDAGEPRFLAGLAFLVGASAAAWFFRRRAPGWAAAWWCYLIVLAPVSGLAQAGPQLVADRYTYLACVPWACLAGASVLHLTRHVSLRAAGAGGVLACAFLGWRTSEQSRLWADPERLWRHTLEHAPGQHTTASIQLAQLAVARAERSADAAERRRHLQEADTLLGRSAPRRSLPQRRINRGVVLEKLSDLAPERREALLEEALAEIQSGLSDAQHAGQADPRWNHARAAVLFKLGRVAEAVPDLELAARQRPGELDFRRGLAIARTRLGQHAGALEEWQAAAQLAPRDAGLRVRAARALTALGREAEARTAYAAALELCAAGAPLPEGELSEARAAAAR